MKQYSQTFSLWWLRPGAAGAGLPPPSADHLRVGAEGLWPARSGGLSCGPESDGLCPP